MNIRTRVQVDGVVSGISRRLVYYPACDSCAGKLTILQDDSKAEWSTYWCKKCSDAVEEKNVHYRYCLVLMVSDKSSVADVTAFGNGWDKLFGVTATNLHKILKKFSVQNTCEVVNKFFHDSIIAAFVGCRFNFKFNVCLTKTIPRGLLTFKTLTNSITHTQYNNLIATNFTITEAEHFKTVLNILEAKLLLKDSPSDATVFTVHKEQSRLHDNSYLYGSWLSDTASQEMYLVSLNDKHCCNSIPTQCSLVDSVYWRWEQTSAEDEEIISDVVDHLELSKNEFLTSDDNCDDRTVTLELHSVDSENLDDVYDESFIKDFFSTQNVEGLHSMAATNLTDNQATKTPSATYSPELFSVRKYRKLEVDQHAMSTPPPFSVAKTSTSSRVLFEDESLNSPCLFGEVDCGRTPIGKMSVTADFTSPALC